MVERAYTKAPHQIATEDQAETDRCGTQLSVTADRKARAVGARTSGPRPADDAARSYGRISGPDRKVATHAFDAMMTTRKIDIATIEKGRGGDRPDYEACELHLIPVRSDTWRRRPITVAAIAKRFGMRSSLISGRERNAATARFAGRRGRGSRSCHRRT